MQIVNENSEEMGTSLSVETKTQQLNSTFDHLSESNNTEIEFPANQQELAANQSKFKLTLTYKYYITLAYDYFRNKSI